MLDKRTKEQKIQQEGKQWRGEGGGEGRGHRVSGTMPFGGGGGGGGA